MALTELEHHKIEEALSNSRSVLSRMKQKPLKGKALDNMKILEVIVQHLELFIMRY